MNTFRPVAWVNFPLFNHRRQFASGAHTLRLWPGGKANPIGTCVENATATSPIQLCFEFDKSTKTLFYRDVEENPKEFDRLSSEKLFDRYSEVLDPIVKRDALAKLSPTEREALIQNTEALVTKPKAFAKYLLCVNWAKPEQISQVYRLLKHWAPLPPVQALELLDSNFADHKVREFAVKCLEKVPDEDLNEYLLELTQTLKYEPFHDSPLARFLLRRGLQNREVLGHTLFWHWKSEMHVPEIAERYSLLIEAYLRGCGSIYRKELSKQATIVDQLTTVAYKIKEVRKKEDRTPTLRHLLKQIDFPPRFSLPIFTHVESKGLVFDKCKVMVL
jgi:hypothetical protein